jgi:hypothetical protein
MSCYRITFKNERVFEVVIASVPVAGELRASVWTALMYRVTSGQREAGPLSRADGSPIEVVSVSEEMALEIASYVLEDVTTSYIGAVSECGQPLKLPPLQAC